MRRREEALKLRVVDEDKRPGQTANIDCDSCFFFGIFCFDGTEVHSFCEASDRLSSRS